MRTTPIRQALAALGALGLTLALSACGSDEGDSGRDSGAQTSATSHNDADVTFAKDMIRHHAQALSTVDLTMGRPLDPEIQKLADAIRAAQGPEIEAMTDWLTDWDEEVPETMRDHVNAGHDMGGTSEDMEGMDDDMPGMMTTEDMSALENASDAEFQDLWLEMMVEHHEGAVEMARNEESDGQYKPAVDMAGDIVASQTKEIEAMTRLLS